MVLRLRWCASIQSIRQWIGVSPPPPPGSCSLSERFSSQFGLWLAHSSSLFFFRGLGLMPRVRMQVRVHNCRLPRVCHRQSQDIRRKVVYPYASKVVRCSLFAVRCSPFAIRCSTLESLSPSWPQHEPAECHASSSRSRLSPEPVHPCWSVSSSKVSNSVGTATWQSFTVPCHKCCLLWGSIWRPYLI